MIDFVRHACPKHIVVGAISLSNWFKDVSSPLYTQHVPKDEYAQLFSTDRHESRGKTTRFKRNKHFMY